MCFVIAIALPKAKSKSQKMNSYVTKETLQVQVRCIWSEAGPRGPCTHPMSPTRLLSVEKLQPKSKFNQRSENMQKQRDPVQGDQIMIV